MSKDRVGVLLISLLSCYVVLALIALNEKLTEAFRNGYTTMAPDTAIIVHAVGAVSIFVALIAWLLVRGGTRRLRLWSLSILVISFLCFGAWIVIHSWSAHTLRRSAEIKRNL